MLVVLCAVGAVHAQQRDAADLVRGVVVGRKGLERRCWFAPGRFNPDFEQSPRDAIF